MLDNISMHNLPDKIVLLRLTGCINGKTSDIKFDTINDKLEVSYAYLKNTSALTSSELKLEMEIAKSDNIEEIEKEVVYRYSRQEESEFFKFVEPLMKALETDKNEGEVNVTFENRILQDSIKILNLKEKI